MAQPKPNHPSTVLIVEDDENQRYLVGTLFEASGFDVVECDNAEEALALMQEKREEMALVYTDVGLRGGVDGMELAQTVRKELPEIPVILTSGEADERLKEMPKDTVFIKKPWRALDLLVSAERVRARFEQPEWRGDIL